jgi:hypothetical protein
VVEPDWAKADTHAASRAAESAKNLNGRIIRDSLPHYRALTGQHKLQRGH